MRLLVRGLLTCVVVLAACWGMMCLQGRGLGIAAEVGGMPITALELREALRAHLWKGGEAWQGMSAEGRHQARQAVLEALVNERLIRLSRLTEGGKDTPEVAMDGRKEVAMLRRQFTAAADYEQRLAWQQHTQEMLDEAVRDAQLDERWIAEKMPPLGPGETRAWYDEHKETLRIPEAHHAAHIFLTRHDASRPDREAEIRKIHRQLVAKEKTFATLAKEYSEDDRTKSLGGDLGWFTRQRMPADFVSAVEKLRVGEVSGPVPTALGWHLIRVFERRPSRLPTFEECRHEIAAALMAKSREAALKTLLAELRRRLSAPIVYHQGVIEQIQPAQ